MDKFLLFNDIDTGLPEHVGELRDGFEEHSLIALRKHTAFPSLESISAYLSPMGLKLREWVPPSFHHEPFVRLWKVISQTE